MNLRSSTQQHLASLWPSISETIDRVQKPDSEAAPRLSERERYILKAYRLGWSTSRLKASFDLTDADLSAILEKR